MFFKTRFHPCNTKTRAVYLHHLQIHLHFVGEFKFLFEGLLLILSFINKSVRNPPLQSWTDVLFTESCALFSPNMLLLITAKEFHLNLVPGLSGCSANY